MSLQNPRSHCTTPFQAILIYLIVALFLVFEMGIQVAPSVMSTRIMTDLGIGSYAFGWMSGFYFYTYALMQIPSGLLFDRFKPRIIVVISILVCALGSFLFGNISNFYWGCLARLLTGFGSAFAFVSVLVVASDLFEAKYFALITGLTQMLAAFGAMMGQLPVSLMVKHFGWRHSMELLSLAGLVLALLVWKLMNYRRCESQLKDEHFSDTPTIMASLKKIVRSPQTWFVGLYAMLLWAPMSGFASLWGVPFLEKTDNLDPTAAAFYCSLMWLGLALMSPLLGALSALMGQKKFPLILSALMGSVSFGLILFLSMQGFWLGLCLILAGGACAGQSLSFALIKDNNAESVKATALAFNNMAVVISGALFQPLIGRMIAGKQLHDVGVIYSLQDYRNGLMAIFVAYVVALVVSVFFIREKK